MEEIKEEWEDIFPAVEDIKVQTTGPAQYGIAE